MASCKLLKYQCTKLVRVGPIAMLDIFLVGYLRINASTNFCSLSQRINGMPFTQRASVKVFLVYCCAKVYTHLSRRTGGSIVHGPEPTGGSSLHLVIVGQSDNVHHLYLSEQLTLVLASPVTVNSIVPKCQHQHGKPCACCLLASNILAGNSLPPHCDRSAMPRAGIAVLASAPSLQLHRHRRS